MRWTVMLMLLATGVLACVLLQVPAEETAVEGTALDAARETPAPPAASLAGMRKLDAACAPTARAGALVGRVLRGGEPAAARIEIWSIAPLAPHADVGLSPPLDFTRRLEPIAARAPLVATPRSRSRSKPGRPSSSV